MHTLGDEQLARVLRLTYPHPLQLSRTSYGQRREFLLRCRRVCKQWQRVAERVRFEHVRLGLEQDPGEEPEGAAIARGGKGGVGQFVRTLHTREGGVEELDDMLAATPALRQLEVVDYLEGEEPIEGRSLERVPELRQLSLNNLELSLAPSSLPNLTCLVLLHVNLLPSTLTFFLSEMRTPNLRNVLLGSIGWPIECDRFEPVLPALFRDWQFRPSRLDVLQLNSYRGVVDAPKSAFEDSEARILVSFDPAEGLPLVQARDLLDSPSRSSWGEYDEEEPEYGDYDSKDEYGSDASSDDSFSLPPYLHIRHLPSRRDFTSVARTISSLEQRITAACAPPSSAPCPLKCIILAPFLSPAIASALRGPGALELHRALSELHRTCQTAGVEVVYEARADGGKGEKLCETFLVWVKTEKIKRTAR